MTDSRRTMPRWFRYFNQKYWRARRKRAAEAKLRTLGLSGRQAREVASRMY